MTGQGTGDRGREPGAGAGDRRRGTGDGDRGQGTRDRGQGTGEGKLMVKEEQRYVARPRLSEVFATYLGSGRGVK